MIKVKDQLGDEIKLQDAPQRIVSLVPSQTELLYDLGLDDRVVGITRFCVHPEEWFRSKKRIGGTKNVNIERVRSLDPDLIIGNKEENTLLDIQELREIAPVWMSDIFDLNDACDMITGVGEICQCLPKSVDLVDDIRKNFSKLKPLSAEKSALYLIWKDPFMGAAEDTFINHILTQQLGFQNVLHGEVRYPTISLESIDSPDYIFLSTEPYPFNASHVEGIKQLFPAAEISLVDGEYFTWYGSRLKKAPSFFQKLLMELKLQ